MIKATHLAVISTFVIRGVSIPTGGSCGGGGGGGGVCICIKSEEVIYTGVAKYDSVHGYPILQKNASKMHRQFSFIFTVILSQICTEAWIDPFL